MGAGGEIGAGIFYDTHAALLMLTIGYGAAAGWTNNNLTGAATSAHIHGPAMAGQVTNVLADLEDIHFVAFMGATNGGIIQGGVMVDTNDLQDLLDGLWYVNIHTATNPAGEIRGQLIVANSGPELGCPGETTTECGETAVGEVSVSDPDGDDVTVMWSVNGQPRRPVLVPGDAALAGTNIVIELDRRHYRLGTNVVRFRAMDTLGETDSCAWIVVVEDPTPPVIRPEDPILSVLWPPNHKLVPVTVSARVRDACGAATWGIVDVTSNESINGVGDGNTEPDWIIDAADPHTVNLRAERSGNLTGRVYTIHLEARDASGNVSDPETVEMTVPHDQRKKPKPVKKSRWWRWHQSDAEETD